MSGPFATLVERTFLEASYRPQDVPNAYYLVVNSFAPGFFEQLGQGYLKGVRGVSQSPAIIKQHLGNDRDVVLEMPGKAFEQANKVSRVLYGNPDYVMGSGGAAYKRVSHSSFVGDLHIVVYQSKLPLLSGLMSDSGFRSRMTQVFKAGRFNNVNDFARRLGHPELVAELRLAIPQMMKHFEFEQEWTLKKDVTVIPQGTVVYFVFPALDSRFNVDYAKDRSGIVDTKAKAISQRYQTWLVFPDSQNNPNADADSPDENFIPFWGVDTLHKSPKFQVGNYGSAYAHLTSASKNLSAA